jgi:hypothetical protein
LDLNKNWLSSLVCVAACLSGCSISTELTEQEKALLVTEQDFQRYGYSVSSAPSGQFVKTEDYMNLSTDLSYQTPEGEGEIYIHNSVTLERSASNAIATELASKGGMMIGLSAEGVKEVPLKLTKQYGARSSLAVLKKDGKSIGNSFTAVIDKKIVVLIFSGTYFESADEFQDFIDQKMVRVSSFGDR